MPSEMPSDNIYVSNLPNETDETLLRTIFEPYGTIAQCRVLAGAGRDKACALVRFNSVQEATAAIEQVNGGPIEGLAEPLMVRYATQKGGASPSYGKSEPFRGAAERAGPYAAFQGAAGGKEANDNLYVTGLPAGVDNEQVTQLFAPFGQVVSCKVLAAKPGMTSCAALVRFQSEKDAVYVQSSLHGQVLAGNKDSINITFANNKGQQQGGGPAALSFGGKGGGGGYGGPAASPAWGAGAASWGAGPAAGGAAGGAAVPSDNLYVLGLPPAIDDEAVRELFGNFGTVMQCKVLAKKDESSKGAALVRFATVEEAVLVKAQLHGQCLDGYEDSVITIRFATQKGDRQGPSPQGMGAGAPPAAAWGKGGASASGILALVKGFETSGSLPGTGTTIPDEHVLYVAGLPADTEAVHLFQMFSSFGPIMPKGVRAMQNPDGSCKGYGFINFMSAESVQAAASVYDGVQLPDGQFLKASAKVSGGKKELA